jgi:outer membrane protein assembly factor BamB
MTYGKRREIVKKKPLLRLMFLILLMITFVLSAVSLGLIFYRDTTTASARLLPSKTQTATVPVTLDKKTTPKELDAVSSGPLAISPRPIVGMQHALFWHNKPLATYKSPSSPVFLEPYTAIEGVLTFRGNALRNTSSCCISQINIGTLQKAWEAKTGTSSWGGGAGWTGQPALIKWPDDVKQMMNIKAEFKKKADFVEVIYASLDGNVYFLDLATGKPTRPRLALRNPIKGSVTLDPRGFPLLYVGQGIPETGTIGYRIFSLLDQKLLYFIDGKDKLALRGWGAFDSAPLINKDTDTLILAGENGLIYNIKLNTMFDRKNRSIGIKPEITKYRYKLAKNNHQGIESSPAAYKNLLYVADNGGNIQCINLTTMQPVWFLSGHDDTDATLTIEEENGTPFLYTGSEVDKQGTKGYAYVRKINGLTGSVIWEKKYSCFSLKGKHPVNGGMLATNVLGKKSASHLAVFTLARYGTFNGGLMVALDKKSGKEVWRWNMSSYAWSSPVDVYDSNGRMYLIQADSVGKVHLLDGKSGKHMSAISLGANIEATPAVFGNMMVVASRSPRIFGIQLQ